MSKQDIEKRLGFAAQGVKETTRTSVKAAFAATPADLEKWLKRVKRQASWTKGIVQSDARSGEVDSDTISELKNFLLLSRGIENKNKSEAKKAIQALKGLVGESMLSQLIHDGLIEWANSTTASRPGAKAEMGFLSRVGYAATALTADPADPKSPEYRKQVSEAKAAAKDAITNYKFMRDKVKERLAALDAYVTNAIKVINSATSAKDIEHYVEQLRIAVKSQSMILGASKSPFARPGVKAKFAKWESTLTKKHGKPIEEYTARLKGGLFMIEVAEGTDGPYAVLYRWDDLRGAQRIASGNLQSLMRQAESMGAKEARGVAAIERISNYSRPGAKAKA